MTQPRKINIFFILFSLLIDLALIGMSVLLYYHFLVRPLAPVDLSPIIVNIFGSKQLAVWVISGVPFIVGVFSLLRMPMRLMKKKAVQVRSDQ